MTRPHRVSVTDRALLYGLTPDGIESAVEQGDMVLIGTERERLEKRVQQDGFEQTIDAMTYTWFNRFATVHYMELHGYRVLSHPESEEQSEILEHTGNIDLPDLNKEKMMNMNKSLQYSTNAEGDDGLKGLACDIVMEAMFS